MAETKWLGKYRAIVMDNNDPERRGRIRVQCPTVLGDYLSSWCEPCIPYATDYAGDYYVPPVSEAIWVEFEEGDVDKPIWGGGWYKIDSSPLTQDANPTDYRYIVFKNSVLRMGEKEFIFELRDGDDSYTVIIDTSTWLGLNYIGSKSEQELGDLQELINNKNWLLVEFPTNVSDNINILNENIKTVSDALNNFISESYNPTVTQIGQTFDTLSQSLETLSGKIVEIDNNLRELQRQIDEINSRIGTNADAYNQTIDSMAQNPDGGWTYWYMS